MANRNHSHAVLFVLKIPPPFGGGEIAHQQIYNVLGNSYDCLLFSRRSHNKSKQGRLSVANLFAGLVMLVRVWFACLKTRPKVLFIWLPKDFGPYLRTLFIVTPLSWFGVRCMGDLHGMSFDFLDSRWKGSLLTVSLNRFSAIRVLGNDIAENLRQLGFQGKLSVINNGIVVPEFVLNKTIETPVESIKLLHLGAISEAKGFARALDVITALKERQCPFTFTVVGEWVNRDFQSACLQRIREQGLSDRIEFHGVKVDEAKWRAIAEQDLLLHFTRWDGQPLTIIETMAAGIPTIAHAVGAIPDMIESGVNGFLLQSDHLESVDIITDILEGRVDYVKLGHNARQTYNQRFTVDTYIKNIELMVGE